MQCLLLSTPKMICELPGFAFHTPRTSGTHACVCTQQMQHLDSNHYHDATSMSERKCIATLSLRYGLYCTRLLLASVTL